MTFDSLSTQPYRMHFKEYEKKSKVPNHDGLISQADFVMMLDAVKFPASPNREGEVAKFFKDKSAGMSWEDFWAAVEKNPTPTDPTLTASCNRFGFTQCVANMHEKDRDAQKIHEIHKRENCWLWPLPVFTIVITIIQIAVFTYYESQGCVPTSECPQSHSTCWAYRKCCRDEVWRWITYSLVHKDATHLGSNVVLQLLFGVPLEIVNGSTRTCILYVTCAIAGSFASSIFDPSKNLVGASGAGFGILGAWLSYVVINLDTLIREWKRMCPSLVIIVAGVLFVAPYTKGQDANTSVAAHAGGFLIGAAFGTCVLKNEKISAYERPIKWAGITISFTAVMVAFFFNIFNDPDENGKCASEVCATYGIGRTTPPTAVVS